MKKPIIIFGSGKIAEVISYFFNNYSDETIAAFAVDKQFIASSHFQGLPLVDFSDIEYKYPPSQYNMFIAIGYQNINILREDKCHQARMKGYRLISYIHPSSQLPAETCYGDNCFFMGSLNIHPYVSFGNNVFVWSGCTIGHHSSISDNCWITSDAHIAGCVTIKNNCFIAINSTIVNSITVSSHCFIGSNSLITKSTQSHEVYISHRTNPHRLNSIDFFRLMPSITP